LLTIFHTILCTFCVHQRTLWDGINVEWLTKYSSTYSLLNVDGAVFTS